MISVRDASLTLGTRLERSRETQRPRQGMTTNQGAWDALCFKNGGEGGIRTLDTLPYTHFPGVRLRPLGHLSVGADFNTGLGTTAPRSHP